MVASYYAWDPEFDCITAETDADGVVTASYTQEPKLYGGLISQHRSGASSFYHYDAIGTTRALTNSSQVSTDSAVYTAFGENVASVGSTANSFGFGGLFGYYTQNSPNDVYVRARSYQCNYGRWMSVDRPRFRDGINFYAYSRGNPLRFIDRSGLTASSISPCCCCCVEDVLTQLNRPWDGSTTFGHVVDIGLRVNYLSGAQWSDCTFEWWEKFDNPPSDIPTYEPGEWLDVAPPGTLKPYKDDHQITTDWESRKRKCDTGEQIRGQDFAWLRKRGTMIRNLWVKIIVKSGKTCVRPKCIKTHAEKCFYQRLKIDRGIPDLDPKQTFLDVIPDDKCAEWDPPTKKLTPGAKPGPKP